MELARTSIEAQSLAMKVEALSARVDFYERRVRGLENTAQPVQAAPPVSGYSPAPSVRPSGGSDGTPAEPSGDSARRRRRRRRGRRGPGAPDGTGGAIAGTAVTPEIPGDDEGDDGQPGEFEDAGDGALEQAPLFTGAPQPLPDLPPSASARQTVSEPQAPAEPAAMPIADAGQTGTPEES
jgi:ribonuclease E